MNGNDNEKKLYESLTKDEKQKYDSVMNDFPSTSPESAYDVAIQGGVRWQFIPK